MKTKKIVAVVLSACLLLGTAVVANADEIQTDETMETTSIETDVSSETDISETEISTETEVASETDAVIETDAEILETDVAEEETEEVSETEISEEISETDVAVEETEAVAETETPVEYDYESAEYESAEGYMTICFDYQVKSAPDPDADVICTLPAGTEVHVTGLSWDAPWNVVEIDGQTGYINRYIFAGENYSDSEAETAYADYLEYIAEAFE